MEMKRSKQAAASPLFMWTLVAGLLSQNFITPALSIATFEDQKNYYYTPSPTDPHAGSPPGGSNESPPSGTPPSHSHHGGTPSHSHHGDTPSHGTPSHGGQCSPTPSHGTPPSHGGGGSHHDPGTPSTPTPSVPTPSTPGGGGGYSSPPPTGGSSSPPVYVSPPDTPTIDPGTPDTPTPSTPGGGGGYYSSPPPTGGSSSPPVYVSPPDTPTIDPGTPDTPTPSIDPGTPSIPSPPFFPVPNTPFTGTCNYWSTHPTLVWGVVGWLGNTLSGVFGSSTIPGFSPNLNLLQALSNTRTDGYGALYREGTASLLNSMVNHRFPYTTTHVRDSFMTALGSNKAAASQAQLFKMANEGRLKPRA